MNDCLSKCLLTLIWFGVCVPQCLRAQDAAAPAPYGLTSRVATVAYLRMPHRADGRFPALLSETGAFLDTRNLVPAQGLIPYDLVVPFWSDGAAKSRWIAVPAGKITFSATGEWRFPAGTVFVKTFEFPTDQRNPAAKRRLETRLLVCDSTGGVYGVVYKWRSDNSDADLLPSSLMENIPVISATGELREQSWYYPSRQNCLTCHNDKAGGVLGVKTRQLNRPLNYSSKVTDNQLRAWNHIGLFEPDVAYQDLAALPKLAAADDRTRSLEDRARSYLDANCAHCHRPGGTVAYFDARYDTPLEKQQLLDGPVLLDQGLDRARVIAPHDIWRSIALMRVDTNDDIRMPPLARETIDWKGVALLREWILSLPGRPVLDPPIIYPQGGTFVGPVEISLQTSEPDAQIRYTLDGSVPTASDTRYEHAITISEPTMLRARAFKDGYTRSIPAQQLFLFGN